MAPGSEKLKEAERLFENLTNKKEYGGDIVDLARALTNGKSEYALFPKGSTYVERLHSQCGRACIPLQAPYSQMCFTA